MAATQYCPVFAGPQVGLPEQGHSSEQEVVRAGGTGDPGADRDAPEHGQLETLRPQNAREVVFSLFNLPDLKRSIV